VMLAKQLATLDVLCEGRLSVGLGIGGREEDHLAVSADPARVRNSALAEDVEIMRRAWRGEEVVSGLTAPIEPKPVQPGGPELLAGAMGPRAVRLAASWADGLTGFSWGADPDEVAPIFENAQKAWGEEGRKAPKLKTGFWVAVGEGAQQQLTGHLSRYLSWLSPAEREQSIKGSGFAGSAKDLRALLRRLEDLGAEEVNLVSTRGEPDEVDRLADAVG
jgi:alkanesulfonate monooxygenase SsuD/methylene tetrahydromethanopterin reductase-like flavin-dependent oxidoreductase (luciferase family)